MIRNPRNQKPKPKKPEAGTRDKGNRNLGTNTPEARDQKKIPFTINKEPYAHVPETGNHILELEPRNRKRDPGDQRPVTRNQEPEVRSQILEARILDHRNHKTRRQKPK